MKKIVWLCTYSNAEKLAHVRCWRRRPATYGLWIPDFLRGFVGDSEYEIHVVSYTLWQKRALVEWKQNGIHYHSYRFGMPFFGCSFPRIFPFDVWTRCWLTTRRIRQIVDRIHPDLIHLFGAENQPYAQGTPELAQRFPLLITLQGFINRERSFHKSTLSFRRYCESEIAALSAGSYFTGEPDSLMYVQRLLGRTIKARPMYFPVNEELINAVRVRKIKKTYDCVFLARICKQKGILDFLRIVKYLHRDCQLIRVAVAGPYCSRNEFYSYCKEVGIDGSAVDFLGCLPDQESVYEFLSSAKVYIIPTYNDAFPTTIRECSLLGTAVAAYRTGGISHMNPLNRDENIVLSDQGDWVTLAGKVARILGDDNMRMSLMEHAYMFANKVFLRGKNVGVIKEVYEEMLK